MSNDVALALESIEQAVVFAYHTKLGITDLDVYFYACANACANASFFEFIKSLVLQALA
jgi:hypothetical protein